MTERVQNLRFRVRYASFLAVLAVCVSFPSTAESPDASKKGKDDWRLTVGLGLSHDDNAYRQAGDPISSGYVSALVDLGYRHEYSERTRFFAAFDGERDYYERSLDNADAKQIKAEVGFRFTPYQSKPHRLRITPRVFYELDRKVYVSRQSGLTIEDEADRFNFQDLGVEVGFEYKITRAWTPYMGLQYKRRDYLEDFGELILVDSLDYDDYRIRPGLVHRHGRSRYTLELEYRKKSYLEKFPRASDGTEILPFFPPGASEKPFEPLEYTYRKAAIEWHFRQSDAFRWKVSYEFTDRTDEFLDYMSYTGNDIDVSLFWTLSRRWRIYAGSSYDARRYDNARINFDPTRDLRRVTYARAVVRATYQVSPSWEWFAFYRYDNEDNVITIFDYDRSRFGSGVRFLVR